MPYIGDLPYIFVSYSHKDKAIVYPEITRMHEAGYRVWYDEGIVPTEDSQATIELALDGCVFFIVFISPNAMSSKYVINEIHLAADEKDKLFAIYLEPTKLPPGVRLRIGRFQALRRYEYSPELYWSRLQLALPEETHGEYATVPPSTAVMALVTVPISSSTSLRVRL